MTELRAAETPVVKQPDIWRQMLRVRRFDEAATRLLRSGRMPGVLHLTTGQEAVVAGTCAALAPGDQIVGTHRNHGYPVARGGDLKALMAEVLGKSTGICKGKGGELHLFDPGVGVIFNSAILGSGVPVGVGVALSAKMRCTGQVVLITFGDGASNEGAVHESMNLAAIWKLPVVFLCENNGYAVTVPASYAVSVPDIAVRAAGYGMPGIVCNGSDPIEVRDTVAEQVERARAGLGPSLVEAKTYRTVDHAENLPSQPYRSQEEVAGWRDRDPLRIFKERLLEGGTAPGLLDAITAEVEAEITAAVEFAEASPAPRPEDLWDDMYVDPLLDERVRMEGTRS